MGRPSINNLACVYEVNAQNDISESNFRQNREDVVWLVFVGIAQKVPGLRS